LSARALVARDLSKSYADRVVLDGVDLVVPPGRRTGLVGDNGAGKTTLLRLLAGLELPDAGAVDRPDDIGFLRQELPFPADATIADVVDTALADVRAAARRLAQVSARLATRPGDADLLHAYAETLEWAEAHDLWDADRRADRVLDGLGLAGLGRHRTLATMSGGERSRAGLAALLIRRPAALLLDEPTNHLDDAALDFVQAELAGSTGVVVVVSHDRVFLDAVCTQIVDLDRTRDGITVYGGTYTDYLAEKRAEKVRWYQQWAAEQEDLSALRHTVVAVAPRVAHGRPMRDSNKPAYDRHGERVNHQVSRRVRNARARLDDLTRNQVRKPPATLHLQAKMTARARGDGPAIAVRELRVDGRLRLDRVDIETPGRLLLTGANGAGKSTLLEVLAGRLAPDGGSVHRRRGLRVGYLPQDVEFTELTTTPAQLYAVGAPATAPSLADLGLVAHADMGRPVGVLSAGGRRRLALALVVASTPELLLLDEPTNHLSLALVDELEDALRAAAGGVVVATHDRWLRRRWTGREMALPAR